MKRTRKKIRDRRGFANKLADLIHRAGEPSRPKYHPDTFSLIGTRGKEFRLSNVFDEFLAAPTRGRQDVLKACTRTWFRIEQAVPASFEDARPDILPVIRRRGEHEVNLLAHQGGGRGALPGRVFASDLFVGAAYDWPECIAHVNEERLSSWRVSLDDVLDVALGNLRAHSREGLVQVSPGYWVSPWEDDYGHARILLPGRIEECEVRGSPVAMTPHRNMLIVTGSEDEGGLERMATAAEEMIEGPRFLSAIPLVLDGDGYRPFELPGTHPLARRYKSLWHLTMAADYARQGLLLGDLYASRGVSVFAANSLLSPNREWATAASWMQGIVSLLPKTQIVLFQSVITATRVALHAVGEWDRVREVVGDLMEPLEVYPQRFMVRSFPTPEQLEAIRGDGPDWLAVLRRRGPA